MLLWLYYLLDTCVLVSHLCPNVWDLQRSWEVVLPQHLIKSRVTALVFLVEEEVTLLQQVETLLASVVCFWTAAET